MKISAIILVGGQYDKSLYQKCLQSLAWTDEIIKVGTAGSAVNFAEWRNLGAKRAKGDWLLYVDTDEEVTPALRNVIRQVTRSTKFAGYAIPRRNFVFGKEMKHVGLWPDYVLRLVERDKLKGWHWQLHEQPEVDGPIGHLKEPLVHRKHKNIGEMVTKTNAWSEIEARLMYRAHHPRMNVWRFSSAGFREFWQRMIVQTAFLDGTEGVVYALYQVFSRLISYAKLWEMQIKNESRNL